MDQHVVQDDAIRVAANSLDTLSRLTGWVAHEINNPLAGIQNAFALIQGLVPASHPHFKYVAAIERELDRVAGLTRRLQQAYGFDATRSAPMPFARCIAEAFVALDPLSRARSVATRVEIDAVAGSQLIFDRLAPPAIRHLVQHALEMAPSGGSICVRAGQADRRLWVSVPGHEERKGEHPVGTAGPPELALQIVERLVSALGGEIAWLPVAGGTRDVCIWLPIRPASEELQ